MTEVQIIAVGLALALLGVIIYAVATRGRARKDWR